MGESPPLGYIINNHKLEIIEEEARTVLSIFQQTMKGTTPLAIATQIKREKHHHQIMGQSKR